MVTNVRPEMGPCGVTWAPSVGLMSRRTGHLVRNDWCLGNSVILNFRSNERDRESGRTPVHGRCDARHMHADTHCRQGMWDSLSMLKKGSVDKVFMELLQLHFRG